MVSGKPGVEAGETSQAREERYGEIIRSRSDPTTYYSLLGMHITELGEGKSRFEMTIEPGFLNSVGLVHGGAIASIADAAIAAALATLIDHDKETMATVEMKINFMAPVVSGKIVCDAEIIQRGRAIAVGESLVYSGERKLIAKAIATFMIKTGE